MRKFALLGLPALLVSTALNAQSPALTPEQQQFRGIYQQLVEINTTASSGSTKQAAEAMAERLKAGGIPENDIQVFSPAERKGNLVARYRGNSASGKKPILLLGHIDVVEAKREDWETDPFKLQEINGQFVARGAIDDKAMAAIFVANLIQYKKEGFVPDRDIILALTTDEEGGDHNGAEWLVENKRDLVDAEFVINEGGMGELKDGKPSSLSMQLAEKTYQTYMLEIKDSGGHSSMPRKDNPIYRLADGLTRLAKLEFQVKLNDVTRGYFEKIAVKEESGTARVIQALLAGKTDTQNLAPLLDKPHYNAQLRTTCVATMLEAGHAENALPQSVKATVNCRVLPGDPVDAVQKQIVAVLNDPKITVTAKAEPSIAPPSTVRPDVMATIERIAGEMWPGVPIIPTMSAGGTDSKPFRKAGIQAYGISGIYLGEDHGNMHGLNEHVGVKEVYDGKEFLYRLVKELSGGLEKGKS